MTIVRDVTPSYIQAMRRIEAGGSFLLMWPAARPIGVRSSFGAVRSRLCREALSDVRRRIDWSSDGPKFLGAALIVAAFVFWMLTNRVEPLFVTTGGGLVAIGQGAQALGELRRMPDPPSTPASQPGMNGA
jgi:hypothetical protein